MSDDAREVKSRIDIAELVGDYVPLRKSGGTLWGLCPFHSEKTPSFSVSRERQTFHCFGCGKGGDVFSFLMELEGLSFREALELLAARAGVTLSARADTKRTSVARDARALLEEANAFFLRSLTGGGGEAARAYLSRRRLGTDHWKQFEIGWAPASWDALSKHLGSLGYREDDILNAGLSARGDRGTYDRFRGRVMFSVRDEMGKISGFGGRLIDGDGAKYVNSPEGELFNKRRLLYLLHAAKRTVRERGRVILMEGYMDAIRAHIAGFAESVASLGTSLTEEQAALIKRFADLCYIVYDADGAGQEAAIRGMYILQNRGVEVQVVALPKGKDPDDVLSDPEGAVLFEKLLKEARPLPLYHSYIRRNDLRTPGKAKSAREDVYGGLASLPWLDVQKYIPRIAADFALRQDEVEAEIRRHVHGASERTRREKSVISAEGIDDVPSVYIEEESLGQARTLDLECAFCSLIWQDEELRTTYRSEELIRAFSDEAAAGIVAALLSGESPQELESRWRAVGERTCPGRIARGNAVLMRGELGVAHAGKILEDIRTNEMRRRYEYLKPRVFSNEATQEEFREYHECAQKLKGSARG